MYLSGSWHLMELRNEVGPVWQLFSRCSEAFPFFDRHVDKGAEIVLRSGRASSECPCEIRLVSIAEGGFSLGELTIVRVEGIGASGSMDGYSGLGAGNLLVLENMWISLEGEVLVGALRIV